MIEKLKRIHYMFYASLVFMGFPFISILLGEVPYWHFFLALLFIASYLGVLITENKKLTWICWLYLLAYVAGNTLFINANYFWFYFFISNLLVYHFEIHNFRSPFLWTAVGSLLILFGALLFNREMRENDWLFVLIVSLFIAVMTFSMVRMEMMEELKVDHAKQNAQINLLLAENERHRIGRDLHDSLGHTFAMLSVKAELAQQFLQMEAYDKAAKELQEVKEISKKSMADVRRIINNLKERTLDEELVTIRAMLEMSGIQVEIDNQLNVASIPPSQQSTISMILLEAATNIIKHAQAKNELVFFSEERRQTCFGHSR